MTVQVVLQTNLLLLEIHDPIPTFRLSLDTSTVTLNALYSTASATRNVAVEIMFLTQSGTTIMTGFLKEFFEVGKFL
jgi:hypothetical protein